MTAESTETSPAGAKLLVEELLNAAPKYAYQFQDIEKLPQTTAILNADTATQRAVLKECIARIGAMREKLGKPRREDCSYMNLHHQKGFPQAGLQIACRLIRRNLGMTEADLVFLVERTAHLEVASVWCLPYLPNLVTLIERRAKQQPASVEMRSALDRLGASLAWCDNAAERKLRGRVQVLSGRKYLEQPGAPASSGAKEHAGKSSADGATTAKRVTDTALRTAARLPLESGEAWSDRAIADINSAKESERAAWVELLETCENPNGSSPSENWLARARSALKKLTQRAFKRRAREWFALVKLPRTQRVERWSEYVPDPNQLIIDPHMQLLKGLVWTCALISDEDLARSVAQLARSAYKKVPKIGPRAVKVGNACVWALSAMSGLAAVGHLGVLRASVKFGTAQKAIDKAFTRAAAALGLPRDEIEELGVPSYGLEEVGLRREKFGEEFSAELRVNGSDVTLSWLRADGKPQKSIPAKVKTDFKDDLKELQSAAKDITAMLPAQAQRIDSMFLVQKKWPATTWRERYLDHPMVGTIARRLIWTIRKGDRERAGIWHDGRLVGADDAPIELTEGAHVELWHPMGRPVHEIQSWRDWLNRHEVRQPFKQAHRELYLLTDAERRTGTYSNRFAAHVLRQHQFNALCAARGWKNKLRLLVDDVYPPASRELPNWGLRAEFWIEGIGENYGSDTNESGVFLRVSTDQVRFYRTTAASNLAHAGGGGYTSRAAGPGDANVNEPLPLDQVPPLVLSEIMRDIDLFVGVASVGNDPTWQDGGPQGRYRDYWQSYSFGELSQTAKTRREVLESLLPRLSKIRQQCSLEERFLIVRGQLRTYKIHLGSGNILMAPNDEYLCIVPDRSLKDDSNVFLPFEGDSTLSIILSKAFLLAEDTKIKDPTITRQIRGR